MINIKKYPYYDLLSLWCLGAVSTFFCYGVLEVSLNIFNSGGRNFFLTPLELLFAYIFTGMILGLLTAPLAILFTNIGPRLHVISSIIFLHFLLFTDLFLYILRTHRDELHILLLPLIFIMAISALALKKRIYFTWRKKVYTFPFKTGTRKVLPILSVVLLAYFVYPSVARFVGSLFFKKTKKPNVVLIVMDNTRADFLSCYGYKGNTTPNIDAVARGGLVFERFFSNADWTLPSHTSLFTGLYPTRHNVLGTKKKGVNPSLPRQLKTITEYLKDSAYNTVGFSDNLFVSRVYGFDQGFSLFLEMFDEAPPYILFRVLRRFVISGLFTKGYKAPTTDIIIAAFKIWFYRQHRPQQPFFAFLNLMDSHLLWNPPPPFNERFFEEKLSAASYSRLISLATVDNASTFLAGKLKLSTDDFKNLKKLYAAEVAYLDSRLGSLFSFLKEEGAWNNTLLIITSDHGENIGEHGMMLHCFSANNTLTHVPLIVSYPELFDKPKRIKTRAQTVDVLPTVLDILKLKPVRGTVQGKSLLSIVNRNEAVPRTVFSEVYGKMNIFRWIKARFPGLDMSEFGQNYKACYFDDYKYIISSSGEEFLSDINTDFEEKINLIESRPRVAEKARKLVRIFIKGNTPLRYGDKKVNLSKQQLDKLRTLGYTQ